MGQRRRTEPVVESTNTAGDHGNLRRSQSDRTEYSQKLQEKMAPQVVSLTPATQLQEDEEVSRRMMARRVKIIAELLQTEKDYISDLDLCIKEVIQPLRNMQIARFDVDGLFSNIELVHQLSAKLLSLLEEATTDVEPPMQIIGEVFLQIKGPLEDTYKIYCYHHDDAHTMLEYYEKDEELKKHLRDCVQSLKKIYEEEGKPNLMDLGSLLIKPVQRLMKYPLLLHELLNSTPASHPDHEGLQEALLTMKNINVNINELKRRKDLVLKYRKNDDDETLKEKFSRLNIHSISKKSKRVTSHLKILTRGEPQVKDGTFNKEEKLFQSLEKTVKLCVKNISLCSQHLQDSIHLAAQNITELQEILQDKDDKVNNCSENQTNTANLCEDFMAQLDKLVLTPLSTLQALFPGPQKLIQKRYDKLLDYNSYLQRSGGEELDLAKKDYEALNAQLVEELQVFNRTAYKIVLNCLHCFITLLRNIMFAALQSNSAVMVPVPLSSSSICEVQNQLIEEVHKLNFVKENSSATFIERKLSLERKKPVPSPLESPRQTEDHRSKLLSTYSTELLYQAKRKCNAAQEFDIDLHEGELVAVVEQKDPFGSTSRWLVDTGILTGYVYSSFLRPYNPAKAQKDDAENGFGGDDFDDISLFVSSRPPTDSSTRSPGYKKSDSSSPFYFCENPTINGTGTGALQGVDDQHVFYAVYAFQARSDEELSLQEYQRVRILHFSDLSGNKEWWLAEAKGQKGYVPSNYLGKMTYA
ncbi:PREDICTED: rho guanine nucleotide exchange factor 38 [Pseudopodoces humilis]|uniref:rho guanine nucleotide exchange factor 38 n=1 Tax=Pseudopodoces humilis TaxID=181119 RepID=UPI0006B76EC7|nr:PREDICTED: rho guanine nucleotide exchange factor 38 [Pseudopodoces humilis]